jgi:hypothetical protein
LCTRISDGKLERFYGLGNPADRRIEAKDSKDEAIPKSFHLAQQET